MNSEYIDIVTSTIKKAWDSQQDKLSDAAELLCRATQEKKNVFFFGCSHAGIISEEVFYRSGGMVTINPIMFPGFMLNTRPVTMTSMLERVSGIAGVLLDENRVSEGDVLFIHSVSGRNTVPVEMAELAHDRGIHTVALTNLEYSSSVTSRAPSGKRLFEVCDIVIDNCGCCGDGAVTIDGLPERIGPTSTAVGTSLANAIIIEAVRRLVERGIVPPVFMSANIDGGGEHNKKVLDEYKDNIFYMN